MDGVKRKLLTLLPRGGIVLASLSVGLVVCELALRLYYPRYEFAASPPPAAQDRVFQRGSSTAFYTHVSNPDTGVQHRLAYNWLGARTSRRFTTESLAESVNIAFFGDSMTENIHLPVQYVFTEHLDYLLNHSIHPTTVREHRTFNVLNFGLFGVSIASEYLRWRRVSRSRSFDHVFYVFDYNDIDGFRSAVTKGIVEVVGESGNVRHRDSRPPLWKRMIARTHLTYLAIDAWGVLAGPRMGEQKHSDNADMRMAPKEGRSVFRKVVLRWKREVEADGGRFHVVVLPAPKGYYQYPLRDYYGLQTTLGQPDVEPLYLLQCFRANKVDYFRGEWRFVNDGHWNAAANMVVAHCLYRYLEKVLDLPPRTDEALAGARHDYYQAFLNSRTWEGERFAPAAPWVPPAAIRSALQVDREEIVNHYLALEAGHRQTEVDAVAMARAAGALATSHWQVFANLPERLLVYTKKAEGADGAKADCQETLEVVEPFFLHIFPFTREKLPRSRRRYGFENRDVGPFAGIAPLARIQWRRNECALVARLPEWPVARVSTGQFTTSRDADGKAVYHNRWAVDFAMPLARSVWDVYAAEGGRRGLDFVKTPCAPAVRKERFFLHVYPLRASDLPNPFGRYVNRDFQWNASGRFDAAEDTCRISVVLPEFPIATIHTGQFRPGWVDRRLWDVRIRLAEVERLAPQAD